MWEGGFVCEGKVYVQCVRGEGVCKERCGKVCVQENYMRGKVCVQGCVRIIAGEWV